MSKSSTLDRIYQLVVNEEDARVCTNISDEACREVPGNFFRIALANIFTKAGDLLVNPKTVLTWIATAVGAPSAIVSMLVPVRESLSMIPQLLIGAIVRKHLIRKGFWVLGAILQGLAVLGMAGSIWLWQGVSAGFAILGLLIIFSLSRGLCSVAMKDVQGKCIPKSRRGRLTGLAATFSGLLVLLTSLFLFHGGHHSHDDMAFYYALLILAFVAWSVAGWVFASVYEEPGEIGGGGNAFKEAIKSLSLLKTDKPFRHFVTARALLLASALGSPFIVTLAQSHVSGIALLGGFVVASALADLLSSYVWGYFADISSRKVMVRGGALAAFICLLTAAINASGWGHGGIAWLYPLAFFVLSIAHSGVRIGRKTYLLDMAGGNKRTDYTAVSNSVIGVLLLLVGGMSAIFAVLGAMWALLFLGILGAMGAYWSYLLPEA